MANMITVAIISNTKFTQKKLALFSYPSHKVANSPDNLLPIEVARNQPPIINAVIRTGLNFETSDKSHRA